MDQFLKTELEITAWLDTMHIPNYTLSPDETYGFIVNVAAQVNLNQQNLNFFPVKFGQVNGAFYCSQNNLISLLGAPSVVGHNFDCSQNRIISLIEAPEKVPGDFNCSDNVLTSLEHCPKKISGNFNICNNQIISLEFCPKEVGYGFYANNNPSLGVAQDMQDFSNILIIHQQTLRILEEKKELSEVLSDVHFEKNKDSKNKI